MSGVRARLAVEDPTNCPVAAAADAGATDARDVRWTGGSAGATEEFRTATPLSEGAVEAADAEHVFGAEGEHVYRFGRERGDCPCEAVEALACPVGDVEVTSEGTLLVTVHLPSVDPLSDIVAELEGLGETVALQYLVRDGASGGDTVVVDRDRLTDRQRETLRTAYEMGYFEYPREENAEAVADELGIGVSTFAEHLAAAQSTLVAETFPE